MQIKERNIQVKKWYKDTHGFTCKSAIEELLIFLMGESSSIMSSGRSGESGLLKRSGL